MSMLKKLKSIFIEEEGSRSKSKTAGPAPKPKSQPSKKSGHEGKTETPVGGEPTNKFIELLLKAIEANNIEGFDYLEYKQSLQSLTKIEPEEGKRYKSAYAMASTMGLTKKILFDSAQRYANVLGEEERKFAEAFEKQKAAQVTNRENKIARLEEAIKQKLAEIKKLEKEVVAHKKDLEGIESDMSKAMDKVEKTKDNFYGSYNLVLDQINHDIEKINLYIES